MACGLAEGWLGILVLIRIIIKKQAIMHMTGSENHWLSAHGKYWINDLFLLANSHFLLFFMCLGEILIYANLKKVP